MVHSLNCSIHSFMQLRDWKDMGYSCLDIWTSVVTIINILQLTLTKCNVCHTNSLMNNEVHRQWALTLLGRENAWELLMPLAWVRVSMLPRVEWTVFNLCNHTGGSTSDGLVFISVLSTVLNKNLKMPKPINFSFYPGLWENFREKKNWGHFKFPFHEFFHPQNLKYSSKKSLQLWWNTFQCLSIPFNTV